MITKEDKLLIKNL